MAREQEVQAPVESLPDALSRRLDFRLAVALMLVAFFVYNLNFRVISEGDSLPARFLPFAVLEHGSLHLDSVLAATRQGHPPQDTYWVVRGRDGGMASMYPLVAPLLVVPAYVPAWLFLRHVGWRPWTLDFLGELMEKVAASIVASVTVGLLFLLLRRRLGRRDALLLAALFAFATNTWVIGSQALWQHGTGELLVTVALLAMTAAPSGWNVLLAGLATGLLPANRPPDLLLAVGFSLYALFWARRKLPLFVLAAALPILLTVAYTEWMFGNLTGGYGVSGVVQPSFFAGGVWVGVAGLLVSPGKGLFVFSPFLLALPLGFRQSWKDRPYRRLTLCLAVAVVGQVFLYARTDWRAGYSWGPRFLTDLLPILFFLLAPIYAALGRWPRRAFLAAALFSIAVQMVGAFYYQGRSDILMYQGPGPDELRAWRLENTPFWADLQSGHAPMPFLHKGVRWVLGRSGETRRSISGPG